MTLLFRKWKFTPIQTNNGVFETTGGGVMACAEKYACYAESEFVTNGSFIGVFGYGDTPEEARKDAEERALQCEWGL